jgi:hypothetical protein
MGFRRGWESRWFAWSAQQQILFGDDNKEGEGKDKSEMRGSLHCATHDEAVSRFGRDDAVFDVWRGKGRRQRQQPQIPLGMTARKTKAMFGAFVWAAHPWRIESSRGKVLSWNVPIWTIFIR